MPKRKNNADPVFKTDVSVQVKKDKYVNPNQVFDYKKSKSSKKKNKRIKKKIKTKY